MRPVTLRNFLFTLLLTISISNDATCQQFPHQVQQFFQSYIVKPLEEKFNKKAEEFSGIINHYINSSSSSNSSGNTNETFSQLPDDISLTKTNSSNSTESNLLPAIANDTIKLIESLLPDNEDNPTTVENPASSTKSSITSEPDDSRPEASTAQTNSTEDRSPKSAPANILTPEQAQTIKGLCPELAIRPDEDVGRNWRYFEARNQCFKLTRRGPCGAGMILYSQEVGSIYGVCDCLPFNIKDGRMMVYENETDSCSPIFSKGNCKEDEWIDLTRSGDVICTTNPCASNGTNYVWFKETCVEIAEKSEHCKDNEFIGFRTMKRTPMCVGALGTVQTGPAPCPPGSYQAIHGKCHVDDWEFGDED